MASSRNVGLVDGTVKEVEAGDGKSWQRNVVRLEERVMNVGGQTVPAVKLGNRWQLDYSSERRHSCPSLSVLPPRATSGIAWIL